MTRIQLINAVIADFNAGISLGEIGKKYKITRNAAAGIISRARARDKDLVKVNHKKRKRKPPVQFALYDGIQSKPGAYLLTDLAADGCRYSTETVGTTHLFCGNKVNEGSSYCAVHHKRIAPISIQKGELSRRPSSFKIFNR